MSPTRSNPPHISSDSLKASRGDQTTRASQFSFHYADPQRASSSPLMSRLSSGKSNILNSPTQSGNSAERPIQGDPHLPKTRATKRDKLVGEAERVISKVVRDPELHERAILRAAGGKGAADGLAVADPNKI